MSQRPDLRFDIDALFSHMIVNLDRNLEDEMEWLFTLRSPDFNKLARIADSLSAEFQIHLQEHVEVYEQDETCSPGHPLLAVVIQDALSPDEVKALAARFGELADTEGVEYEGVSCAEPFDEEEAFGWLDLEAACCRLRHFTDTGLKPGDDIPFVFLVESDDVDALKAAADAADASGMFKTQIIAGEDGGGIIIRCDGRNDEALLTARYRQIETIAADVGADFIETQFFDETAEFSQAQNDEADDR